MRPMLKLMTLPLAAAAMTASTGASAADFYLDLGPVKPGASKIREAAARAEVTSWSWGLSQGGAHRIKKTTVELYVEDRKAASGTPATPESSVVDPPVAGDVNGDGRDDRTSPRDLATGQASGKRTHNPPARSTLVMAGKFPSCTVGAAYSSATLQVAEGRYQLDDVVITDCGTGGGSGPTNSLTATYLKRKLL